MKSSLWTQIGAQFRARNGKLQAMFRCKCGTEKVVDVSTVRCKRSRSCGCERKKLSGKRASPEVTYEAAANLLKYDAESGLLFWKCNRRGKAKEGDVAGSVLRKQRGTQYLQVRVNERVYKAHRIAWLLATGSHPQHQIDHINGNGLDNRLVNLRDVPKEENAKNVRRQKRNKYGVTGIRKTGDTWEARIGHEGKAIHIGTFSTKEEAMSARKYAERQLGFSGRHGTDGAE